jgi:hypothetical protein
VKLADEQSGRRPSQEPVPVRGYHLPMNSKHRRWQARWQIDVATGLAVHETGLRVRLAEGRGVAENAAEVALALVPQHGAHNAPAMVQRLVREGAQLLVDPQSRGWRN